MKVLLVSTYELGRQPFGLASPAAWLRHAGVDVSCLDLSRQPFRADLVIWADLIAFYLPMHTATRLALLVIQRVRALKPSVRLCCYGLYAPLNARALRSAGVAHILGGEFEADLVQLATKDGALAESDFTAGQTEVPHLAFLVPDRQDLLPLSNYATLQVGRDRRVVGYTEASRGCKHFCLHCPVVPVYKGRFRVIPCDVVLADIRAQVERGAEHITFGDPDFFNGIVHARRVVEALAREFPSLTYDVTIKVEHLLRHDSELPLLRDTGCLFVTSAVESFDDQVLARLAKGHTREDVDAAVALCRQAGLGLVPTFVPFTPWTTLESYCGLLRDVARLKLVDQVSPIQFALRLLVPDGSPLLDHDDFQLYLQRFDPVKLVHPWTHPDPKVDALGDEIGKLVGRRLTASRPELFSDIWLLAHARAGVSAPLLELAPRGRVEVPYLNEPWYC